MTDVLVRETRDTRPRVARGRTRPTRFTGEEFGDGSRKWQPPPAIPGPGESLLAQAAAQFDQDRLPRPGLNVCTKIRGHLERIAERARCAKQLSSSSLLPVHRGDASDSIEGHRYPTLVADAVEQRQTLAVQIQGTLCIPRCTG